MFLLYAILLPFTIATTCYYNDYNVGSNNFVGFTSNTNIDPSRCLNDNGIICCKCPYGKMVPPSAGTNYFSMTGQRYLHFFLITQQLIKIILYIK